MKAISIVNLKGGVGKTTTAVNIAYGLSAKRKVRCSLLVDMDAQGDATRSLGVEAEHGSVYDVIKGDADPIAAIVPRDRHFEVLPSGDGLTTADLEFGGDPDRLLALREALQRIGESIFDVAVIDCPPAMGYCSLAALKASDVAYIPMKADAMSLEAVRATVDVCRRLDVPVGGFIVCDYDGRKTLSREILALMRKTYGSIPIHTVRTCVAVAEAPLEHMPVLTYDPKCTASEDYRRIVDAIAAGIRKKKE